MFRVESLHILKIWLNDLINILVIWKLILFVQSDVTQFIWILSLNNLSLISLLLQLLLFL